MRKHAISCVIAISSLATAQSPADSDVHWSYTGESGPAHWGELDPRFTGCVTGLNQSPIDIVSTIEAELPPMELDYQAAGVEIVNNGHTVQLNAAPGSTLVLEGDRFELKQLHFHAPSENWVGGKRYAMEAHFVHSDTEGHLAVLGVMFEEGEENPVIAELWKVMPEKTGAMHAPTSPFDPVNLLPQDRDYYRFNGSLTTPPCTEGVRWLVTKAPLTVSKAQVEAFVSAIHGPNSRPVQDVNARPVLR